MDNGKDFRKKARIANAKIMLVELSSSIKTYKESMDFYTRHISCFSKSKKTVTVTFR